MAKIKLYDAFSGIGGFSLAMKAQYETVGYCEIHPDCRQVLERNIHRGYIDAAPIKHDINTLSAKDLNNAVIITAGFPCQDISALNRGAAGLEGLRSGLFYKVANLAAKCKSVQAIFLENSPRISTQTIVDHLRTSGFESIAHGIFSAEDVGAQHVRKRWFCLGIRSSAKLKPCMFKFFRNTEFADRLINRSAHDKACVKRCMMLGNSVVPQTVAFAFNSLLHVLQYPKHAVAPSQRASISITVINATGVHAAPRPFSSRPTSPPVIVMKDGHGQSFTRQFWMTPVHCKWNQYRTLTPRSTWLLSNQIYYATDTVTDKDDTTPVHLRSKKYIINPEFVEKLMGYPKKFTAV